MKPVPVGLAICGAAAFPLGDAGASAITLVRLAIAGMTLGAAAAIDLAEHRIPNRLVLPAGAACAGLTLASGLNSATVAGLGVLVLLLGIGLAAPSTVGMGDIKLMLAVVLALQQDAPRALLCALVLAVLVALTMLIVKGREAYRELLPLAPFLALGSLLALI